MLKTACYQLPPNNPQKHSTVPQQMGSQIDLAEMDRDSLKVLKHKVIYYVYNLCDGTNNHFASSFLQEVKSPSPGLLNISMAAWPV